jgi:hypothetical protein
MGIYPNEGADLKDEPAEIWSRDLQEALTSPTHGKFHRYEGAEAVRIRFLEMAGLFRESGTKSGITNFGLPAIRTKGPAH